MATLALVLAILAQDDPWKDLKIGDRVELTFNSGHTVRGEVSHHKVAWKADYKSYDVVSPADPQKDKVISLDLNLEYVRLVGILSVEKSAVQKVRKLQPLSPEEKAKRLDQKKQSLKDLKKEELERIEAQKKKFEEEAKKLADEAELQKPVDQIDEKKAREAREFYKKFPEGEGWGPRKHEELSKYLVATGKDNPKYIDVRKNNAPADPREEEFFANYDLWRLGKKIVEETNPKPGAGKETEK